MRDWPAFTYKMREQPDSTLVMAVASDYLQEHNDPRWEALAWMAEMGKVGALDGYWSAVAHGQADYICYAWLRGAAFDAHRINGHATRFRVSCRLFLLWKYARADEATRAEWLRSSDWERRSR